MLATEAVAPSSPCARRSRAASAHAVRPAPPPRAPPTTSGTAPTAMPPTASTGGPRLEPRRGQARRRARCRAAASASDADRGRSRSCLPLESVTSRRSKETSRISSSSAFGRARSASVRCEPSSRSPLVRHPTCIPFRSLARSARPQAERELGDQLRGAARSCPRRTRAPWPRAGGARSRTPLRHRSRRGSGIPSSAFSGRGLARHQLRHRALERAALEAGVLHATEPVDDGSRACSVRHIMSAIFFWISWNSPIR